jgi:hypothetical protein
LLLFLLQLHTWLLLLLLFVLLLLWILQTFLLLPLLLQLLYRLLQQPQPSLLCLFILIVTLNAQEIGQLLVMLFFELVF